MRFHDVRNGLTRPCCRVQTVLLQSSADFDDTTHNRNLIDAVAEANNWAPYRSVVCLLMYHLQEDNLVLV